MILLAFFSEQKPYHGAIPIEGIHEGDAADIDPVRVPAMAIVGNGASRATITASLMADENLYRWAMVAGFIAVVAITLPHRIRSNSGEPLDRRKEGVFMLATLRPVAAALWFSIIAYMINPAWMAWSSVPLAPGVRWLGALSCACAVSLLLWALPALGKNLTDTVVTRADHTLVTRGAYRWIRHPFYVAMAALTLGCCLLAANWFMFASGIVVFALLALRSRVEEEQLLARFGEPYREYRERTGRFFPKLWT